MPVHIGDKPPNLTVSEWVQGNPPNIDRPLTRFTTFIEATDTDFSSYGETEEVYV